MNIQFYVAKQYIIACFSFASELFDVIFIFDNITATLK